MDIDNVDNHGKNRSYRLEELSDIDLANSYIQQVGTADLKELEVVETLGRGSESMVYKAKLKGGNKFFALKLLKKINGNKINSNEFLISKKLKDKNVAKILYLKMEKEWKRMKIINQMKTYEKI